MDDKQTLSKTASYGLKTILWALGISVVFFIPWLPLGVVFTKGLLLTLGASIGLILYLVDSISVGRFIIPRGKAWKVFLALVISSVATSFFVSNPTNSFIGSGFDTNTVATLSVAFVYFFLISVWGHGVNFTKYIFKTILVSGMVATAFSAIQLSLDVVGKMPKFFVALGNGNLVGSFHDLAFVITIFIMLLAISIEANFWRGPMKIVSMVFVVLGLFVLFFINYTLLWYLLGFSGLAMLILGLMPKPNSVTEEGIPEPLYSNKKRHFSVVAFLIVFCAFVGVIGSKNITIFLANPPMNFIVNEPRPSIRSNLRIIQNTYYNNPMTGAGLNRFNQSWEMGKHKILGGRLVGSQYWNTTFNSGNSIFLWFITTLGIVGSIFLIWFTLIIGKNIVKIFDKNNLQKVRSRELLIYGFTGLYAFILFLFDVPSTALFILIIALFAIIVVRNQTSSGIMNKEFWFIRDVRHSFFGILGVLALIILSVFVTFVIMSAFYAGYLVNKASSLTVDQAGIAKAQNLIARAINTHGLDSYVRLMVDANLVAVARATNDSEMSAESLRSTITTELSNAVNNARMAIATDPNNYQNYVALLKIQETISQLGDTASYSEAIETSNKILSLSPNNVGIMYRQARLSVAAKEYAKAYDYITNIIAINPSFTDAYILRSQISLLEGNPDKAINEIDEGIKLNNSSAVLPYQRGLIYMNQKNYSKAVESFETALRLSPRALDVYSSLALAYEKLGQKDNVLRVLNIARNYVSDKTQIDSLIAKVNAGGLIGAEEPVTVVEEKEESGNNKTNPAR